MYKRILVPTDFSEYAEKAIAHAIGLAEQVSAEVVFFHAFLRPMVPFFPGGEGALRQYLDEALQSVANQLEELADKHKQVHCRAITHEGRAAEEIVSVARDEECDLICMSTHGHGGLGHVFLGSVAERVIHKAHCPVLVVRVITTRKRRSRRPRRRRKAPGARFRIDEDGE